MTWLIELFSWGHFEAKMIFWNSSHFCRLQSDCRIQSDNGERMTSIHCKIPWLESSCCHYLGFLQKADSISFFFVRHKLDHIDIILWTTPPHFQLGGQPSSLLLLLFFEVTRRPYVCRLQPTADSCTCPIKRPLRRRNMWYVLHQTARTKHVLFTQSVRIKTQIRCAPPAIKCSVPSWTDSFATSGAITPR